MDASEKQGKPAWSLTVQELFQLLNSGAQGLSGQEAQRRLAASRGQGRRKSGKVSPLAILGNQFRSTIVIILLLATLVSGILGDWTDAIIILVIVLGSVLLSFYQEFRADTAAQTLRKRIAPKCSVLRDGQEKVLSPDDAVPGDVILLTAGSLVPADAIVLEANDLQVDEAALTGETFPVQKAPGQSAADAPLGKRENMVFAGTSVRSGTGSALVVEVGDKTAFGQLAARLTTRPPETAFEHGIRQLGYLLAGFTFALVIIIFVINVLLRRPVLDSLLFSVALAVGLTPQLLPAIVSINLSLGAQAMAKRGVIVRRLEATVNLGSMDVLCTDKTGTLTEGKAKLEEATDAQGETSNDVLRAAYLNSMLQTGQPNPLDKAIREATKVPLDGVKSVAEIPYDFDRKRMSVIVASPKAEGQATLISKGAFEGILSVCSSVRMGSKSLRLTSAKRKELSERFDQWSNEGRRVLGVAQRELPERDDYGPEDESDLTFIGFLLFTDPPKAGVDKVLAQLRASGVEVKVITGDHALIAAHIAKEVGLDAEHVATGEQVSKLSDKALIPVAERTAVFAEIDPNQKERIILALKKAGHVVGYMGDGINDAPSLHAADVGISVDSAVDVAKQAADFVLLRRDLRVLHEGIVWGRKAFANTMKYIFMATSANFGNMFSMAGSSLFLPFLPLLPKQILLINFLNDFPQTTIATDQVDDVMVTQPTRWDIGVVRRFMLIFGPLSSLFDFATFGILFFALHASADLFRSGWFLESVLSAAAVILVLRTRMPFFRSHPSKPMLIMIAVVGVVALALPYSPLAGVLGFQALPPMFLLYTLLIVLVYVGSAELAKRWFYSHLAPARRAAGKRRVARATSASK
jgi:Mg2+-importing ATPase